MSISGWLAQSTIFGVRIHAAQSRVGKVLSYCAMWPPIRRRPLNQHHGIAGVGDVQGGLNPRDPAADYQRAFREADVVSEQRIRSWRPLPPPFASSSIAFSVVSGVFSCTHEHCSRMFAISTIYGFSPAVANASLEGRLVQPRRAEAITTRSRLCSLIASATIFCPGSRAHVLVVGGVRDPREAPRRLRDRRHIHRLRDIRSAPANKNANSHG